MKRLALVSTLLSALSVCATADPALLRPSPELAAEQRLDWAVGRSFVHKPWVSSPATTTARDGLGPWFNANSCLACHGGNGQGQLPEHGPGLILRLPSNSPLGSQLQDRALPGFTPEGTLTWQNKQWNGFPYRHYFIAESPQLAVSPRLAPELRGVAAIDTVSDEAILAFADPDDSDGNGISGRAARLADGSLGRFGWKASNASLADQIAQAFAEDMGIDNPRRQSRDCYASGTAESAQWTLCQRASGADPGQSTEISEKLFDAVLLYFRGLNTATAPTENDAGAALFARLGCADCHRPSLPSSTQVLYLYSDLLLHDMGEKLADAVAEGAARGEEWRTAPLWGLGYRSRDPDNTRLLHDGRARSIDEAIQWHGGEARRSIARYRQLSTQETQQLIRFLQEL